MLDATLTPTRSRNFVAAALVMAIVTAAAPMAVADPPGYLFQDFDRKPPANSAGPAVRAAPNAANQNADNALAIARQALQEAQQALQQAQRATEEARQPKR
jgi:hypothetical protein